MENKKAKLSVGFIVYFACIVAIPGIAGGILAALNQSLIYLEVLYVIFGLVDLLLITIRIRLRDSKNYKKNKTIYEDKKSPEYIKWIKEQYLIAVVGVIDLLISLIVYLISLSL